MVVVSGSTSRNLRVEVAAAAVMEVEVEATVVEVEVDIAVEVAVVVAVAAMGVGVVVDTVEGAVATVGEAVEVVAQETPGNPFHFMTLSSMHPLSVCSFSLSRSSPILHPTCLLFQCSRDPSPPKTPGPQFV